jgi:hypothetical protein
MSAGSIQQPSAQAPLQMDHMLACHGLRYTHPLSRRDEALQLRYQAKHSYAN